MLRKIFFVLVFIILCNTFLSAQPALNQGALGLSGSIYFNNSSYEFNKSSQKFWAFVFSPSFSYFMANHLSLGTKLYFTYEEQEFSSPSYNQTNNLIFRYYGIGPEIRYYFGGNKIVPVAGISVSYNKSTDFSTQEGHSYSGFAGLNYFLSNSAALEPFISYSISHWDKPDQDVNTFSIGIRTNYFIVN